MNGYAQLHSLSNFSFLRSASHPQELVEQAYLLGYSAIAITDECSLAGVVKAHVRAKELGIKLIVGSEFHLEGDCHLVALVPSRKAYHELSGLITLARRRMPKGQYQLKLSDLQFRLKNCLLIWLPDIRKESVEAQAKQLKKIFKRRLWIGWARQFQGGESEDIEAVQALVQRNKLPLVACPKIRMHHRSAKPLLDVVTGIRLNQPIQQLGDQLSVNAECCMKSLRILNKRYPADFLQQSLEIADFCNFSLDELRYQYPEELVPDDQSPIQYLRQLVEEGAAIRWPEGIKDEHRKLLERELELIEELHYEYYFLTVHDLVRFARSRNILCQGRGSAANSVVCYCLGITEISPDMINMLFERFISRERDEPPDIDVDFEHQRREEVIQYIYQKYGRERAALAATVITYRARSAIRDVGKALGMDALLIDELAKSLAWWDRSKELQQRIEETGMQPGQRMVQLFYELIHQILGFPRHLSQHVGGFIITQGQVSELVPLENAAMPDRTVIQWDKEDLESMGLLKVDVLALGMLSAIRRALELVSEYEPEISQLSDIPKEDPATYDMLCRGDSIGVFQVESRAQMSMLPRLKPREFYDLVIEIAIVRPGPIQGDMVHPFLRRRDGIEKIDYPSKEIEKVLKPTLGVPIFQEQAIRMAMVAAGFSGGEADNLRRAMASWGKNGNLMKFEKKLINGMLERGYTEEYANRIFEQIKGFGGYGFPEAHSASFALLCYVSSWLKCHHPAAFYCALLNSLPMGFYSASQLVQDAQRHNILVLPVDVQQSNWESTLEIRSGGDQRALRLGFCRIKGLSAESGLRIERARGDSPYQSATELSRRAQVKKADLERLASADALNSIAGHRYQARWQASGVESPRPLLEN
ncbi:MAG: error-prone DNA polymerase [Porticoccaceae bacterium]|nr:error-prone DNA polymerase [Porticoccaceae bacterium]